MVAIAKRMRVLKTLLNIRLGPGAAILPKHITKLHMDFAYNINDGHRGSRKFWREYLPRLKYHNPSIPMTVSRSVEQSGPAIFNVYFRRDKLDPSPTKSEDTESPSETPASSEGTSVNAPFKTTEKGDGVVKYVINKRTPGTATGEEVTTINMKHRNEEDILAEFMDVTGAVQVQPTPGELETMRELEEQAERSKIDYQRNNEVKMAIKREQDMLKQAREMIA